MPIRPGERPVERRPPLRDEIHARLADAILVGELGAGTNLTEVQLAADLGVSRTPLREALLRLEADGFVETVPSRGFFVTRLDQGQARELYPVLWALEGVAVELAPPADAASLARLRELAEAPPPATAVDRVHADAEWHDVLVGRCGNSRLIFEIRRVGLAVRRYELASIRQPHAPPAVVPSHADIVDAVARRDPALRGLVQAHWKCGLDRLGAHWPLPS